MKFEHGSWIEGYGEITGLYHTETHTVYICYDLDKGYSYYKRPF